MILNDWVPPAIFDVVAFHVFATTRSEMNTDLWINLGWFSSVHIVLYDYMYEYVSHTKQLSKMPIF